MADLNLGSTRALIDECRRQGLLRNQCAYVLATSFWETARTMKPVREMGGEKYLKSKKYYPYVGMGFVQLTWLANYEKASKILGVDFVKNPKLLLEPKHAIPICVTGMRQGWFTGKKLSDYITLKKSDFVNARRIINGVDKKNEIAKIAREYDADLKVIGYGEGKPVSAAHAALATIAAAKVEPVLAGPQAGTKPDVFITDGPKKDETTVVIVPHPQNTPAQASAAMPKSRTGIASLIAILVGLGTLAFKFFFGGN